MKTNVVVDISTPVPYLAKLQLWVQMLSANKTAGFFKMLYLKEEVNNYLYFRHANKYQSLLQVDTIISVVFNYACLKHPK